jgi:hypothetical protein
MSKTIKFIPFTSNDDDLKYVEIPKPAKNFIPDWWKEEELSVNNQNDLFDNLSFKACVPFLDSLTSGYMVYTSQDILVKIENEKPFMFWQTSPTPVIVRERKENLPVPIGHDETHFAWNLHYGFEIPKGYSLLITHPLNRFDLPFTSVSGIVDDSVQWAGRFTFWLKKDFQGVIPKGTPIAQIIPFKRDSWKSERADYLIEYAKIKAHEKSTIFSGYYKKFIHKKKSFK